MDAAAAHFIQGKCLSSQVAICPPSALAGQEKHFTMKILLKELEREETETKGPRKKKSIVYFEAQAEITFQ